MHPALTPPRRRSLIFSGRPAAAWDEYLRLDSAGARTVALLQLIGDDCYRSERVWGGDVGLGAEGARGESLAPILAGVM